MGSKNRIAERVVDLLPAGHCLVDLFAGGCAITHCALLSGKWEKVIANDLSDVPQVFCDAMHGRFRDEDRWISREDFLACKDEDPYARLCFSFGNDTRTYCYSKALEPYKKALHYAVVFDDWSDMDRLCPEVSGYARNALNGLEDRRGRRLEIGRAVVRRLSELSDFALMKGNPLYCQIRLKTGGTVGSMHLERLESLQRLQRLESLESLERLERLESLERLQRLEIRRLDYRDVAIPEGAVVYADPPYGGTGGYGISFDNAAFADWARTCPFPVYVSEYAMPEDFVCVLEVGTYSLMARSKSVPRTEKVFLHKKWAEREDCCSGRLFATV